MTVELLGVRQVKVTKHRAPKGALRLPLPAPSGLQVAPGVTKHRAPKGALRHDEHYPSGERILKTGHKAPSAKRCIKTWARSPSPGPSSSGVTKHRAPKGALRLEAIEGLGFGSELLSQSTERQKVH